VLEVRRKGLGRTSGLSASRAWYLASKIIHFKFTPFALSFFELGRFVSLSCHISRGRWCESILSGPLHG
jgi:hypothetical protein